jgi:hypothetical protein
MQSNALCVNSQFIHRRRPSVTCEEACYNSAKDSVLKYNQAY